MVDCHQVPRGFRTRLNAHAHIHMKNPIRNVLAGLSKVSGACEREIQDLIKLGRHRLPMQYLDVLRESNGLEGFVASNRYLIIWPANQLAELNKGYGFSGHAPYLFLFGSNGGDAGFAFDTRHVTAPVVEVPFVDLTPCKIVGKDFDDFIVNLSSEADSF